MHAGLKIKTKSVDIMHTPAEAGGGVRDAMTKANGTRALAQA
jgi:hypothetical protein